MKRREFLTVPAASLGGLLVYSLAGEAVRVQAQDGDVRIPLRFFTAAEARTVQAACARILPSDESGPGATEANAIVYIDRQLAGPWGVDKYRYTKGPWIESVPEHGYQGKDNPREIYRAGLRSLGGDFATLPAAQQDERLRTIEHSVFFELLRTHAIEGMFSDPLHGGNAGLIGWQLVGFPGPLMSYREEIDKYHGLPFEAKPKSLEQVVGHKIQGWEDEKI
jgi:gluconate 2-dehydrogenase gamma chain